MTKDLDEHWKSVNCAPLDPRVWFMGKTTHNREEPCHYIARGDYVDRWGRGNMELKLKSWRVMTIKEALQYNEVILHDRVRL